MPIDTKKLAGVFPDPVIGEELVRTCISCHRTKPITAFSKRSDNSRTQKCAACSGGYDAAAIRHNNQKKTDALKQLVAMLRGKHINAPHISELCESMVGLFGGVEGLAIAWKEQIETAERKNPGSKTVLDQYRDMAKLIIASTAHRKTAPDVLGMDLEEVVEELQSLLGDKQKVLTVESTEVDDDDATGQHESE